MSKAFFSRDGLMFGRGGLGTYGAGIGSVRQLVHDGDTVNLRLLDNLGVRLLGIDTPELSYPLPSLNGSSGRSSFVSTSDERFVDLLADPFSERWSPFSRPITPLLKNNLQARCQAGSAANQHRHAKTAERALEQLITSDLETRQWTSEQARLFMAFATDIVDGFGRLLCFLNVEERDRARRQPSYNQRLLASGEAAPYFIWPNVDPFRRAGSIDAAAQPPIPMRRALHQSASLGRARSAVKAARNLRLGIYGGQAPLQLQPFELRFIARRSPPSRWVIDLNADDDALWPPQAYVRIQNPEDRLFVPPHFIPLLVSRGWATR